MKEITLLGQNVNAYHGAGPSGKTWDLARLLGALSNVDGIERLRFTTSHPNEMTDALIAAHRDLPKLMPYLHLPFQAGSDRILKAMNRKHTMADYFRIVEKLGARGRIWRFRQTSLWAFPVKATQISRKRCRSSRQ